MNPAKPFERRPAEAGDVSRTGGDTTRLQAATGWAPATPLEEGLRAEVDWACRSS